MDNVFVADGSVFPSSGAQNPTLTIMATALRNATRNFGHGASTTSVATTRRTLPDARTDLRRQHHAE